MHTKWEKFTNLDSELKKELLSMNNEQKNEAFAKDLEFGTAGMRGLLGVGTDRLNIYTVRKATLGLAKYLLELYPNQKIKVAIGYDSRHKSVEFSEECARVLATYKIETVIFDRVKPTPVLSFLVREEKCQAGIMITASHNPKEYNGYKVYNETGAQLNLVQADLLIEKVNSVEDILNEEFVSDYQEFVTYIDESFDNVYLNAIADLLYDSVDDKNIKVVFTPVHGTSQDIMPKAFEKFGYENFIPVVEQMTADPEFTYTKSSNPEELECYELAIKYAQKNDADLIIANDPDADRLGIMVKHHGEYIAINGNQTGTLLIDYLKNRHSLSKPVLFKTIVTGEMGAAVAKKANIEVRELLTGFKFIGEQIDLMKTKQVNGEYFFGYEESYGYLIKDIARDKDAIQAAMLVTEMTNYYLEKENKTLVDKLEDLYKEYGYYDENTYSITLSGIEGLNKIKAVMKYVSENPLANFAGNDVTNVINYKIDDTGLPKADVMKFMLANGWVVFRPSGTEPKLKVYVSIKSNTLEEAKEINQKIYNEVKSMIDNF